MKHKIVIVDDHILIAKALRGIIETFDNFEVMYESENGKVMVERMQNKKNVPDIVLLDISMPIMDGFETATWLRENHPEVLVMTLSMQNDEDSLIKMIRAGVKGYLLKNIHPTELEKALNSLVTNLYYYPDWATKSIVHNLGNANSKVNQPKFTDKELEFLSYTCTELSYKEIAAIMFCSPRTVEGYRDNLFEKLELKTRVGLAVFAIKNNYCKSN